MGYKSGENQQWNECGTKDVSRNSSLFLTEIQMQIDATLYAKWQNNFVGSILNLMAVIPKDFF
jgi:hypothetical protein